MARCVHDKRYNRIRRESCDFGRNHLLLMINVSNAILSVFQVMMAYPQCQCQLNNCTHRKIVRVVNKHRKYWS